jgi:tetratricopeptide (TPR) repeat protein
MNIYPIQQLFAEIYWFENNIKSARSLLKEVAENFRITGEKGNVAYCIESLGLLSLEDGDLTQAKAYLEEALELSREIGYGVFTSYSLVELSLVTYKLGDMQAFKQNVKESLSFRDSLSQSDKVHTLTMILGSLSLQMLQLTPCFLSVMNHHRGSDRFSDTPLDKQILLHAGDQARQLLGEAAFESAYAEGAKMSLDDALDLALEAVEKV